MSRSYNTFMLSDEPKICGIPIITALPCAALTVLGLFIGMLYQGMVVGAILSLVMHFKFGGQGIRTFLSIAYWSLPRSVTVFFGLRRFPDSANRIFLR